DERVGGRRRADHQTAFRDIRARPDLKRPPPETPALVAARRKATGLKGREERMAPRKWLSAALGELIERPAAHHAAAPWSEASDALNNSPAGMPVSASSAAAARYDGLEAPFLSRLT